MGMEKTITDRLLSEGSEKGLWSYMEKPLMNQILGELDKDMLNDVTFVFGHTHKPFQDYMNFKGYPHWVNVYNTGGWIVESVEPTPIRGGAVILVDEDLNTISLRMYNEDADQSNYSVKVEDATHTNAKKNPLFEKINKLVNPAGPPWRTFSDIAAITVRKRAQNFRARINQKA